MAVSQWDLVVANRWAQVVAVPALATADTDLILIRWNLIPAVKVAVADSLFYEALYSLRICFAHLDMPRAGLHAFTSS